MTDVATIAALGRAQRGPDDRYDDDRDSRPTRIIRCPKRNPDHEGHTGWCPWPPSPYGEIVELGRGDFCFAADLEELEP